MLSQSGRQIESQLMMFSLFSYTNVVVSLFPLVTVMLRNKMSRLKQLFFFYLFSPHLGGFSFNYLFILFIFSFFSFFHGSPHSIVSFPHIIHNLEK